MYLKKQKKLVQMKMAVISSLCSLLLHSLSLLVLLLTVCPSSSALNLNDKFLNCLSQHSTNSTMSISDVVYTPKINSSYSSILHFTAHNERFTEPYSPRPRIIITPTEPAHIQAAITCSKRFGLQIRTRSGGHDFEGLSWVSYTPYILIDMINLRSIDVDEENEVAWVQVGATLGELYYAIAERTSTLAFPGGICPNVGVGGHMSGGGYGILQRKYGLAADNVIDAQLVDVHGRVLDRESMGEDLFWAIRGGGGSSFGVIISFKIQLVRVPSSMTVCATVKMEDQNAIKLVHDWQSIAPNFPKEMASYVFMARANTSVDADKTVQAAFQFLFQGGVGELIALMEERYPQLGLAKENCQEIRWIQAGLIMAGLSSDAPTTALLNRTSSSTALPYKYFVKMKSDYVQEPIPESAIRGIWERISEAEGRLATIYFVASGGKMSEIPETQIPYPHRAGNLYFVGETVYWENGGVVESKRHINWNRRLHEFMKPYVSKSPRQAYLNYRDLDIGKNNQGYTSFEQASIWGFRYFKNNFYRLAQVKAKVDPQNFFQDEQSIPPHAFTF